MANFTHADFRRAIAKAIGHLADWWDRFYKRRGIQKREAKKPSRKEPKECSVCGNPSRGPVCCRCSREAPHERGRVRLPIRKDTDYD